MAVVINVNDGPGTAVNSAYTTLISRLRSANIIVLGFVPTNYGNNSLSSVQAQVSSWKSFYPSLNGIFFGGMSNQTTKQSYYQSLQTYAKTTKAFTATMGDAGTIVPTAFLNGGTFDTVITYEGAGVPNPTLYAQYDTYANNNIGLLPYGIATLNAEWLGQVNAYVGWVYMTNDGGDNPWDTLPAYFDNLVSTLNQIGAGTTTQSTTDPFGISKVYYTKTGGEEWFMNMNDPTSDERFTVASSRSLFKQSDGSWQIGGDDVRLEGWSPAYTNDTTRLNARWLNVEITSYSKLTTPDSAFQYALQQYSRGGHHSDSYHCDGSALKGRLYQSGQVGVTKEICHADYTGNRGVVSVINGAGASVLNKWIGMKLIMYNVPHATLGTSSKQEIWLDRNVTDADGNLFIQNNWVKVTEYIDDGNWAGGTAAFDQDCGPNGGNCGRAITEVFTVPGGAFHSTSDPRYHRNLVALRTDGGQVQRYKYFSAREIDPAKPVAAPVTPPGGGGEPSSVFDAFGTRKIYPTKTNGAEWYMNTTSFTGDSRLFGITNAFTKNSDGSFKCRDTSVLIQITQPNGYNQSSSFTRSQNHTVLASNGVMQDVSDWRNVEMTGYFKINSTPSSTNGAFAMYVRGGRHVEPQPWCEGTAMHGALGPDGSTQFSKEQWHLAMNPATKNNQIGSSIIGKWVGFKYVVYNRNLNGVFVVKQEIYVDTDESNTWIKVDEHTDAGGWGNQDDVCQGAIDQLIIWGGPLAAFKWDIFTDVDFKKLAIREIFGGASSIEPPPPSVPSSCQNA